MIYDLNIFIKNKTTTDFMLYKAILLAPDWIMWRRVISHWCLGENRRTFISLSYTEKSRRWIHVQPLFIARFSWREILHKSVSALHQGEGKKKRTQTCIFTINASLLPLIHYVHISLVYYDSSYRMKPLHALHFSSTGNYSAFKIKMKKGTGWTTFTQRNNKSRLGWRSLT